MMEDDESAALVEGVRRFTRDRLVPIEKDVEESNSVPDHIKQQMRELGLYGLTIPEEYGGLGLSMTEEVDVMIELTWASIAFRSAISMNIGVGAQTILLDGTDEQKTEWLPRLADGSITCAFALTEPMSGSDSAALRTSAVRDGEEYILNGSKRFITNIVDASVVTVMARTNPERLKGNKHITAFLVPTNTPGVKIGKPDKKMGQKGAVSADLYLENVRVPATAIVGGVPGRGFLTAMKALDRGRINIAASCVGQAKRILYEAVQYATEREQFGQAIANFQLIQSMLADSYAELYAAESMVKRTAQMKDAKRSVTKEASACKMFASEVVGRIADRAVQIFGGAGYMADSVVERLYRDVRLFRIYEGTTQIQQLIIAKNLLRDRQDAA